MYLKYNFFSCEDSCDSLISSITRTRQPKNFLLEMVFEFRQCQADEISDREIGFSEQLQ